MIAAGLSSLMTWLNSFHLLWTVLKKPVNLL